MRHAVNINGQWRVRDTVGVENMADLREMYPSDAMRFLPNIPEGQALMGFNGNAPIWADPEPEPISKTDRVLVALWAQVFGVDEATAAAQVAALKE